MRRAMWPPVARQANPYAHVTNEALAARHDETMPAATGGGNTAAVSAGGARRAAAAEVRKHRCVLTLREVRSALLKAGKDVDAIWRQIEAIAIKAVLSAEERLVFYRCVCMKHWIAFSRENRAFPGLAPRLLHRAVARTASGSLRQPPAVLAAQRRHEG